MSHVTAVLADGSEIENVYEVVEGSNGLHLKKEVDNSIQWAAYIPFPQLDHVYCDP